MRDVTLVILNSLRIKCHIRRPLNTFVKYLELSNPFSNTFSNPFQILFFKYFTTLRTLIIRII